MGGFHPAFLSVSSSPGTTTLGSFVSAARFAPSSENETHLASMIKIARQTLGVRPVCE